MIGVQDFTPVADPSVTLVFMCDSVDSGVRFYLTIKSYSLEIVIDVFFVLLFLVTFRTSLAFVFPAF